MNQITCVAIDDEPLALLLIENFCKRRGGMEISTFCSPEKGLESILRNLPDIVFLDVEMNEISGLKIAEKLPKECALIFTTAHAQYAVDGFDLDAVDFLYKPFSYERFLQAVDKAERRHSIQKEEGGIIVISEYKRITIPFSKIVCIEALGNYCKIYCTDASCILSHSTMKSLQNQLPAKLFVRVHRSYIISTENVVSYNCSGITLRGMQKIIPIGEKYAKKNNKIE